MKEKNLGNAEIFLKNFKKGLDFFEKICYNIVEKRKARKGL